MGKINVNAAAMPGVPETPRFFRGLRALDLLLNHNFSWLGSDVVESSLAIIGSHGFDVTPYNDKSFDRIAEFANNSDEYTLGTLGVFSKHFSTVASDLL